MTKPRVAAFVTSILTIATLVAAVLYQSAPVYPTGSVSAVALLAALAITGEMLAFFLPNAGRGSIAFIPYLASVVLVPSYITVIAVASVKAITETLRGVQRIHAIFNVGAHALVVGVGILVYRGLGGVSFLSLASKDLSFVTKAAGIPAIATIITSITLSSLLVCAVIALDSEQKVLELWRENILSTIGADILSSPIIFVFAWLYADFGPFAAATLWVPILGLRQVHKANIDLEQTNQELLELMVKSIEARDPYTSGHSRRVQHFSIIIARALALPEKEVQAIGRAALLHDVGKIYEKYAPILSKQDKLDAGEWVTMKEHPVDGANLISTMSRLRDFVPPVRHHHENWDGSGYPDGLREAAIPLASRIIRFADTLDAMTTERPYRRPMGEAEVRGEFVRCRGRQFDPEITDRLLGSPMWSVLFSPMPTAVSKESGSPRLALVQEA